ncbi:MAG: ZIP family metal transporter [Patescibacteria group bacterium]
MATILWILGGTFVISLISVIGIFTLFVNSKKLDKILILLVGLSAGALMGGAFFHLIPEAVEGSETLFPYAVILLGFSIFFLVEKFLHWRHCHKGHCEVHTFGYLNVLGDGIHNFIDGLIIAASFMADINLGIAATIAVGLHEIPQEISDFGVLIYSGFKKTKALALNYISASTVILGGLIGWSLGVTDKFIPFLIPLAAGGFIYIAAADLLPEIKKEGKMAKFLPSFGMFLIGLVLMYVFKSLE